MAIIDNPKTLDLADVQGMVTQGYGKLFRTAYFMLKVTDAVKAKEWIKEVLPLIDSGDHTDNSNRTLHLAFGANGLSSLGLKEENLATFPYTFREGLVTENRNRVLGDYGDNAPKNWRWGRSNDEELVLIFHAVSMDDIKSFVAQEKERIENNGGLEITYETDGYLRPDNKEPFGFHDGISQPVIKGSGRKGPDNDIIETGEFLLGYKNEHGLYPDSPFIVQSQGNMDLLKSMNSQGHKDLGYNGTFMVFRQMEQHVEKFWKAMESHTLNADGSVNEAEKVKLASKCIGRWPSGASLVNYPDADPGGSSENNDFGYADKDPDGLKCPFGSHLRRNNPRDAHRWYDKKQSLKITNRHRIIRRGRNYEIAQSPESGKPEIGLQFICFNANIELQFEFIQHAWANNNQMRHLTNDVDVIIGVPQENNPENKRGQFTIQGDPTNEYVKNLERFVTIKGGGYFFFPSISAIEYISTL